MKKTTRRFLYLLSTWFILFNAFTADGQISREARKTLYEANQAYLSGDFARADSLYNLGAERGDSREISDFNAGNSLFRQDRFEEAAESFRSAERSSQNNDSKARALYNLGNTLLKNENPKEAVDAYKQSLRLNPKDADARHNLALAKQMLQEQEEQSEGDGDNDDENDGDDGDQNEGDQNEGDDQQDGDQNKDGEDDPSDDGKDQNKDPSDQNDQDKDQKREQQAQPGQISKEDAERMLEELNRKEKELMQSLMKKKSDGTPRNIEKDW